jgi:SAM-dependent methyltransferase
LDGVGYSERSDRKSPYDQFHAILERYLFVAEKVQLVLAGAESELAESKALEGDARCLPIQDSSSIDGIIFSPPYSFAIDYLENDSFHLNFLGTDIDRLREEMIGLRGRTLRQKFELYETDMEKVLSECARVLRPGRICTIVVGTNNNQLSKILEVPPGEVKGIDELLVELGKPHGLNLIRKLSRQITGMANTMRTEFIVLLQRR